MTFGVTPDYLLIGHMTADLTPTGRLAGGTVSYATRTAASFGLRVALLTSAVAGDPLLDALTPYGEIISIPATETTTYENIYLPAGRVQYVRGVAAPIGAEDIPAHFLNAPLVHLAPIADEVDPQIAHQFKDSTVLLTLQGWLRRWDGEGRVHFKRWYDPEVLKSVDIVVFSEEDIVESPQLEAEFAGSVKHLFVTRAEKGGTYYHEGNPHHYSSPHVDLVNPTGAGDVFAAALLASLPALHDDMRRAVNVAARLGATAVTRNLLDGAPTSDEVQAALREAANHPTD
ncbi:MAG: PfkB family carbohydrate kinase, partial [Chloroflexota bacterium]